MRLRPAAQAGGACSQDRIQELARAGDPTALAEYTRCYLDRLLATGRLACGDEDRAKDAVQDTLLAAAQHIDDFRGEGSLQGWLNAIVIRACARQRRGQKNSSALHTTDAELQSLAPTPEQRVFQVELATTLSRALGELSEEERSVVLLTQVQELTGAEAATELQVKPEAVRKRLSRARTRLRDKLKHLTG